MTIVRPMAKDACGCDAVDPALISVDGALDRITACVSPVQGIEEIPLMAAHGRVLAEPIRALADMPRFDHAAMDGYALRQADLTGAGPWQLPVVVRTAAGECASGPLPKGAAARIFTGAPIPAGADCVVMQEKVERTSGAVILSHRPQPGAHIRLSGEEFSRGTEIITAGRRLTPRGIAAAAASGHGAVPVIRKLRVALLISGSEIARPGAVQMDPAQIWDVNTPMLRACLSRPDIELIQIDTMPDDRQASASILAVAARRSDLVITTGGVSVGEEDHLHAALSDVGGQTIFAGVAIKPGKPVAMGRIGGSLWLGLPGNPQSAFVTWSLFGETILRRLTGCSHPQTDRRLVVLSQGLARKPGRCEVRAATLIGYDGTGREIVACQPAVHSGQVGALSGADGFVFLPAEADQLAQNALVEFLPLSCS